MVFLWLALLSASTAVVGGDVVGESTLQHTSLNYEFTNQSYGSNYDISKYDNYTHVSNVLTTQGLWVADYDNLTINNLDTYQYNPTLSYITTISFNLELAPSESNDELIFDMSLRCKNNNAVDLTTNIYVDNISFQVKKSNNSSQTFVLPPLLSRVQYQQNGGSLYSSIAMVDFYGVDTFVLQYDIHYLNDYYYDMFYDEGYDKGYSDAVTSDEVDFAKQQAYEQGFEQGKTEGVQDYLDSSEFESLIEQHEEWSYNAGYQTGYGEGLTASGSVAQMNAIFTGILDVGLMPVNFFLKILNFEVFGINIGGFVTGLFTLSIIVMLFRMFFGGNGGKEE